MKVFLSSTAQDLVAYRKVADDTILRMSQEAVVMERFGPLPGEPVAECERKASECDVVVCIVAHRYGFVPEKGKGSIPRREVEAAKKAGRDVLVWIVADDHPWTEKRRRSRTCSPIPPCSPTRRELPRLRSLSRASSNSRPGCARTSPAKRSPLRMTSDARSPSP